MLTIGQGRLEQPPPRGLLEGPAPDVVAHVLGPDDQDVLPPHEGTVVARLDRATRRERPVEQAAVGREQVDVELLRVERPRSEERRVGKECRSRWGPGAGKEEEGYVEGERGRQELGGLT